MVKTKEMIVDHRKKRIEHAPILIDGAVVELGESFSTNEHGPNTPRQS